MPARYLVETSATEGDGRPDTMRGRLADVLTRLRDLGSILAGHSTSRGVMFVVFIWLARVMEPVEYGYLNVGFGLAAALSQGPTSVDAGYVLLFGRPDVDRAELAYAYRGMVSTIVAIGLATGGVVAATNGSSPYGSTIALGIVYASLTTLYSNLPTHAQARGRFGRMAAFQTLLPVLLLLGAVATWWTETVSVTATSVLFTWSLIAAALAAVAFGLVGGPVRPLRWPRRSIERLVRSSAWLVVATITFAISLRFELFVVASLLAPNEAGIYAVALRYVAIFEMMTAALATLVLQRAGAAAGAPLRELASSLRAPTAATLVGGLVVFLAAPWLVPLLFGHAYSTAVAPSQLLVAANVPMLAATLAAGVLYRAEQPRGLAAASVAGLLAKLAIAVPLVNEYGTTGGATAALLSSTVVALTMAAAARRVSRSRDGR